MFGLDERIAALGSGRPLLALVVAALLGLRHPLDPDHLAAIAVVAKGSRRRAALVGISWGGGHATTMLALGVPAILWSAALPLEAHEVIEACVGIVVLVLGLRLLLRHGRGVVHAHPHPPPRSLREAYGVGVLHGAGGSASVGVLMLASLSDRALALAGLLAFALAAALAMSAVAAGVGRGVRALSVAPVGGFTCAFGLWYLAAAAAGAPYPF
jgi:hypothetical protein